MELTNHNLHLTYCTNIHPGETWPEVETNLKQYLPQLKTRLSSHHPFGVGLRLANIAAKELLQEDKLAQLKGWLQSEDLYVFTLNGFPYGEFHHKVVKDKVYAPDWSKVERLDYTLRLIRILAVLLPDNINGGISTLPISYKPWCQDSKRREEILYQSSINLAQAIIEMVEIHQTTGKLIHIDLEPEPDGMLENSQEIVEFFQNWLLPIAGEWLRLQLGISKTASNMLINQHVRVCYDTCHFAIEYEKPQDIIRRFKNADIKIGKIQLSSAIKINVPLRKVKRQQILAELSTFAESTYLHQVIARYDGGHFKHYADLSDAIKHFLDTEAREWRIHFHVPIFLADYQIFKSTQDHILQLLQILPNNSLCHHLEIETYTWNVLPSEMKLDISTSIEREYQWILKAFEGSTLSI